MTIPLIYLPCGILALLTNRPLYGTIYHKWLCGIASYMGYDEANGDETMNEWERLADETEKFAIQMRFTVASWPWYKRLAWRVRGWFR